MVDPQTEEKNPTDLKEEQIAPTEEPSAPLEPAAPAEEPSAPAEPAEPEALTEDPAAEEPVEPTAESPSEPPSEEPSKEALPDVDVGPKPDAEPTAQKGYRKRGPVLQVVLSMFVPFYILYWVLSTNSDLRRNTDSAAHWILMFIPIVNFYFLWKFFKAVNDATGYSNVLLFFLWLFIVPAPVSLYLTQSELNKKS